jgi:hypothetical protein
VVSADVFDAQEPGSQQLDKLHLTISKHPHLQPLFAKLRSISSHMHKSSQSLDHAVACAKVVGVEFQSYYDQEYHGNQVVESVCACGFFLCQQENFDLATGFPKEFSRATCGLRALRPRLDRPRSDSRDHQCY